MVAIDDVRQESMGTARQLCFTRRLSETMAAARLRDIYRDDGRAEC